MSHLQKLSAEPSVQNLQPRPPRLHTGTLHLAQDSGPSQLISDMLPEVTDWKCPLKPIHITHFHIHLQLQFLQLLAVFASTASPLFELGPDPESPYACVYFSNKLVHMQVSAQPAVQYHRASFQYC